jgi:SAM-dependent methyltransferase
MKCPICRSDAKFWRDVGGVPILRCQSEACGFRFVDLEHWRSSYTEADYYADWTPGPINEFLPWILARVDIVRRLKNGGVVADLGCGIGETAVSLSNAGFSVIGVEESAKAISFLKGNYPSAEWVNENILDFAARNAGAFDVVTLFHVLEHIPHPENAIRLIDRSLRPDGVVVIEVPDVNGGLARLKGKGWDYFVNHHVNYFSVRSLENLMQQFGYRRLYLERTYHFSHPQGHSVKDLIKSALARVGVNSIIRTAWAK